MVFENFNKLINKVKNNQEKKRVAVVCAGDEHTLEAVFLAKRDGIVNPILIGDSEKIKGILSNQKNEIDHENIIHADSMEEAAKCGVDLIRENKADYLMKGKIDTSKLLKAVVSKESGLRTGSVMSHVAFLEIPTYKKLLVVTDGGMVMYPTLEEKKGIVENAVRTLKLIGYEKPKVAALCAVEKVNPKMEETVHAKELKDMSLNGKIEDCIIEGPISYDLVMSKKSARIKGFESPIVEEADILLMPNIATGNIVSKSLIYSANAKMAGIVVGAKVPIVLTSRGSSTEEKYLSLVLSSAMDKGE
ncbi:bifunctional enoyl-CoA hydratase/phosphate acetyltransferase [Anaeromicrobium sediminis]|uniref:Phosphate butyryltransferase n=1 Tax=Anaeromicrobium sediminis TaxID=1478221 RepID=A0A267MJP8_9FIRM|nr:bifunctional enoyl-CoA hydratase/phosphate acetyltransferase [Anaeromicrobium sediminis]PAB59756.1 phosphate butyryltransferase [Anaeromicrobium sediminis]